MALTLHHAHRGASIPLDSASVPTLDALRAFVQTHLGIAAARQVLLTSKGRSARAQSLLTEAELFAFDAKLLSDGAAAAAGQQQQQGMGAAHAPGTGSQVTPGKQPPPLLPGLFVDQPQEVDAGGVPDVVARQDSLGAWRELFAERLRWARSVAARSEEVGRLAEAVEGEREVIVRALGVALESLKIHVKGAEGKLDVAGRWVEDVCKEQEGRLNGWEGDWGVLREVRGRGDFAGFVQGTGGPVKKEEVMLADIVTRERVQTAARRADNILAALRKRVAGIKEILDQLRKQGEELFSAAEQMQLSSMEAAEPSKLLEEIGIILRKITSDDNHVSTLPKTTQSITQASKMALLHSRNYLPNMQEYAAEMNDLVRKAVNGRNNTAETCLQHMQTLSRIESGLSRIYADIKTLDMPAEDQAVFTTINIVSRLPYVYGSLLIEALRRQEWIDKMKRDSGTLAEEMATYQDEESRRRQRWLNSIDDVVRPELAKSNALGIEVNLQAETERWPSVTRQEIQDYITQLSRLQYPDEVIQELSNALRALNHPTKKQIKHAKAFRNGSMHEAAFGTASLALRGEDDFKVLRDANAKLEDELRGQKSRVRKLEDLLHRQTALSRVASGDVFTPQMDLVSSPRPGSPGLGPRRISEDLRPGSSRSRRTSSSTQGGEEKRLARRIVMLEAELQSQREQRESVERDARESALAHERGREEMLEAESVKKDIMQNMEAQQKEFVAERRGLEEEMMAVRGRCEELEDELDRILGSRDAEKSGVEGRVKHLENELKKKDIEKARNVEEMRGNWLAEQERSKVLQEQLRSALAAKEAAEVKVKELKDLDEDQKQLEQENLVALSVVHTHLAPGVETPAKYTPLVVALEDLARRSAAHVKVLAEAVAVAKSENESLASQHQAQTNELSEVRKKQTDAEDELAHVQEQVSSEAAKAESLSSQLDAEREQLKLLRGKFADGETGADALRQRTEEQETEISRLSEQLVDSRSHVNSLDVELMRVQNKLNAATSTIEKAQSRLDTRSARAKDLSQRLFAQSARLLRLLESLGFAVSQKDGNMVIERASKVNGASTTLTEPSTILQRTVSLSSPSGTRKSSSTAAAAAALSSPPPDPSSLSFLHWADATSASDENALYVALQSHLALFNTDTFADALSKRLRDFEYTARKFRLEARNASAKATKSASEAHSKLAVRDFKEGDLALFLPTKGKAVGAWAAFNINSPHHFLREREGMGLGRREWLVARIQRVEERVVDLGRSLKVEDGSGGVGERDEWLESENPFDLSDGLTWYLVHAVEERAGAPTTPGPGKVTVQGSLESAKAERVGKPRGEQGRGVKDLKEKLGKSLESRRSSSTSKRSASGIAIPGGSSMASPRIDQGLSVSPAKGEMGKSPMSPAEGPGSVRGREEQDKFLSPLKAPQMNDNDTAPPALPPMPSPEIATVDPVDDAMASAMASSMRLRTPAKPPPPAPAQASSPWPSPAPSAAAAPSRHARSAGPPSGGVRESQSVRALRSHLASPAKSPTKSASKVDTERAGSLRGEKPGAEESPTRAPSAAAAAQGHRKKNSLPGWRSLWSVDYGIEGGTGSGRADHS